MEKINEIKKYCEVKSEANMQLGGSAWKTQYQIMWNNTPKKLRRTIKQVNDIKSKAKLYVALYGAGQY